METVFLNKDQSIFFFFKSLFLKKKLAKLGLFLIRNNFYSIDYTFLALKQSNSISSLNINYRKKILFFFLYLKKFIKVQGWGYDLLYNKVKNILTLKAERGIFYSIKIPLNINLYFPQRLVIKKTLVSFFSQNYDLFFFFIYQFKSRKIPNCYTGKGIFFQNESFEKKKFLKT